MIFQAFCLTAEKEAESNWHRLKYLPLPKVVEEFQMEITKSSDKGMRKSFKGNMKMRHDSGQAGRKFFPLFTAWTVNLVKTLRYFL